MPDTPQTGISATDAVIEMDKMDAEADKAAALEGGDETAKETAAAEAKAAERDAELAAKAAEDEAAKSDEKKDEDVLTPEEEAAAKEALEAENAKRGAELHTVTVDGKEEKVTLDEALKGYMRQKDYTQKTQHAADLRKEAEAELQQTRTGRRQYAEGLQTVQKALETINGKEPDWAQVKAEHPNEYPQLFADWQVRKGEFAAINTELDRVAMEEAADRIKQRAALLTTERQKFVEAVPEFGDAAKAPALTQKLYAAAKLYGFSSEEVDNTPSSALLRMLNDARQFHEIRAAQKSLADKRAAAQAAEAKATASGKHPAAAPGGPKGADVRASKKAQDAVDRLASTGSMDAATAALEALGM